MEPLKRHMKVVQCQHQADLAAGCGAVELPHALERNYRNAAREWCWQWLFPQALRWRDPHRTTDLAAYAAKTELEVASKARRITVREMGAKRLQTKAGILGV